jgi:hypothetical protein
MIENSQDIFLRWVPPPEIHGTKYKDMFEKNSVQNFDLSDMPLDQRNKAAAQDV